MSTIKEKGETMKGFMSFIRQQGVVAIAVGFILATAISELVRALVQGIINPLIAAFVDVSSLNEQTSTVGDATILWGAVLGVFVNFLIIAAVVYWGVKALGLDKFDQKPKKK